MQILLDNDRYERLEREARESGRSVASLVREAIDLRFSSGQGVRTAAGRRLMAEFTDDAEAEPSWAQSKAELESDLDARLP